MIIDWSKAPEGATHWDTGVGGRVPGWMRFDGGRWHWWPVDGAKCERKWFASGESHPSEAVEFIARQGAWTGEGLPPVGTVCEYRVGDGPWFECEIRYVTKPYQDCPIEVVMFPPHLKGEQTAVVGTGDGEVSFRHIRTPEQIAAEDRDKAINQMEFDTGYLDRGAFTKLYDAGWRKQVTP